MKGSHARLSGILEKGLTAYRRLDRAAGGRLELMRSAYVRFLELRGLEAAAGLAYYALFSLFPLMLFLVAVLSFLLSSSERAYYQTLYFVRTALPISRQLIEENLQQVYQHRGSVGLIGLLWLLWSASGFFNVLGRNVNLAWPSVRLRNMMQSRLVALGMVGGLIALLLLSLISTTVVESLPAFLSIIRVRLDPTRLPVWDIIVQFVPGVFSFLLFLALYLWVPNTAVRWSAAWRGALAAAIAWEGAKSLFATYLSRGVLNYELLYGSLGAITALLFWIYLSSVIILMGAHLVAALDLRAEQQEVERSRKPAHEETRIVVSGSSDKTGSVPK